MKVSIVIPVYNTANYLIKCLNSLINQTYKNIEIILVNDGSTDNSLEICRKYEEIDSRIIVIDKKNAGVSEARNDGLKISTGEYITFVDSDDWIDLNTIEESINILNTKEYDLLLFPYIREYSNKALPRKLFNEDFIEFNTKKEVEEKILKRLIGPINEINDPIDLEILNAVWGKIYKTELIKENRFIDFRETIAEDLLFNIDSLKKINSAIYISKVNYHYNKMNANSLTKADVNNLIKRWNNLFVNIESRINIADEEMIKRLKNRKCINFITISQQLISIKKSIFKQYILLKDVLNNTFYKNIFADFNENIFDLKWRVFFKSCKKKNVLFVCFLTNVMLFFKRRGS